jgi:hypothetical protein
MSLYYPYLPKNSSLNSFKSATTSSIYEKLYGDIITGSYPYSSSISTTYLSASDASYQDAKKYIYALKNTLDSYKIYSVHYEYSSSNNQWDKRTQAINLINIPSIFFGSSIDKGSVELGFYVSGTLIGKIQDKNKNGELIETTGSNTGSVAGVVLYNEGIILLTGSWSLNSSHTEKYVYNPPTNDNPRWIYWGAGLNENPNNTLTSSYSLNFEGVNYISTLTMFAHANKGEFNHSNNPTYTKFEQTINKPPFVSRHGYFENARIEIKNTVKYAYENYSGSLEKQTYISKIGIYDDKKNLIAVAKLAKPIRKPENRDVTFKLKLDI